MRNNNVINQKIIIHSDSIETTFQAFFHVRVALFKLDFLKDPCTESWPSWAQMKAENLRNPKMSLHVPIAASILEL